jgi:exodeoxyribonuclease-5
MSTVEDVQFNSEQIEGINSIVSWFKGWMARRHRKQVFFLTGRAGTGKTSLARAAATKCCSSYQVVFIAPTGKAASRLRQKGCTGAKTLHQFIYNPRGEDEEGDPIFVEKGYLKDGKPLLVVLDEASMVGEYDMRNLLKHDIAVLALGDLGQLEPVKASAFLKPEAVDFELTQIMRQAELSNIVRAAGFVRDGKMVPFREYPDVQIRKGEAPIEDLLDHIGEDAQILCSYNDTRKRVNNLIRQALGHTAPLPQPGEKVMCWFNQHDRGFMNGEQGIVLRFEDMRSEEQEETDSGDELIWLFMKSLTDGRERKVKFNPLSFSDDEEMMKAAIKAPGGFQFGYCATVHKSQGSEWDRGLVIEEMMGNYSKLMYTAYTRFIKNLRVWRNA